MASSSARKIDPTDYPLIRATAERVIDRLQRSKRKAMHQFLDLDAVVSSIFDFEHAYIVGGYLVAYHIGTPWYAGADTRLLAETVVLRLAVSGNTDFSVVPAFLEERAREAGCRLAVVGTALAKADAALASLYSRHGFRAETTTLVKEPDGLYLQ